MAEADRSDEERLDEVQETVDEIRDRLPDEPGFEVADPNATPLFPADDEDEGPSTETTEGG